MGEFFSDMGAFLPEQQPQHHSQPAAAAIEAHQKFDSSAKGMGITPAEIDRWIYNDTECPRDQVQYNPTSVQHRAEALFRRHGTFLYWCLLATLMATVYYTVRNAAYQEWKWRSDPLGAFMVERINKQLPVPDLGLSPG
jgi:hypothetical protein